MRPWLAAHAWLTGKKSDSVGTRYTRPDATCSTASTQKVRPPSQTRSVGRTMRRAHACARLCSCLDQSSGPLRCDPGLEDERFVAHVAVTVQLGLLALFVFGELRRRGKNGGGRDLLRGARRRRAGTVLVPRGVRLRFRLREDGKHTERDPARRETEESQRHGRWRMNVRVGMSKPPPCRTGTLLSERERDLKTTKQRPGGWLESKPCRSMIDAHHHPPFIKK